MRELKKEIRRTNRAIHVLYDSELVLTITILNNGRYKVENKYSVMIGSQRVYGTEVQYNLEENYTKQVDGTLKENRKLLGHNTAWFSQVLEDYLDDKSCAVCKIG